MDTYIITLSDGSKRHLHISTMCGELEDSIVEEIAREDMILEEDEVVSSIAMVNP